MVKTAGNGSAQGMSKLSKMISLCLANSLVSPATAGCLCARMGLNGSAQGMSRLSKMVLDARKAESGYAQRLSNDSELFENLESVMLNGSPKTRIGYPKSRS